MVDFIAYVLGFSVALAALISLIGMAAISIGVWFAEDTGWAVMKRIDGIDHWLQFCGPMPGGYSFTSIAGHAIKLDSKRVALAWAEFTEGHVVPWSEVSRG